MAEADNDPRNRRSALAEKDLRFPPPIVNDPRDRAPVLRRTVPSLLTEACRLNPNPHAFNRLDKGSWIRVSTEQFQIYSDRLAVGLTTLNLARSDRVCLFMESDTFFAVADMACLTAGLVDVPIYLTHTQESIEYVLKHAEARGLIVSTDTLLEQIAEVLSHLDKLEVIVIAQPSGSLESWQARFSHCGVHLTTLERLIELGRGRLAEVPHEANDLRDQIHAHDLATIVYTSGTTGQPKGVMLTHENLTSNALTAFQELKGMDRGRHVALSFLPLTHAFARTLHYGFLNYGASVYFIHPEQLAEQLSLVRPTVFATVPRVLEKFYERILQRGEALTGPRHKLFQWALRMALDTSGERPSTVWDRARLKMADRLVFSRWRKALGGRIEFIISGGAALRADLVNLFSVAGIQVLQGYGLTETSPIISFNRPGLNRAGTVGIPLAGIEVALGPDNEILTRGPHVMRGYYRNPEKSRECIDTGGWLHTGDIGQFTVGGLLQITDRKKDLFKLSTGKYVMPQPLETSLVSDPVVDQAVVVGPGRKFCAALIFPSMARLQKLAPQSHFASPAAGTGLLQQTLVKNYFSQLIERANQGLPEWSRIQHFRVLDAELTVENGFLTPTLKVRRALVQEAFAREIEEMYQAAEETAPEQG